MDVLITDQIYNLLMIAMTFSIVLMTLIQKLKTLTFMKNNNHIMIADFVLSFLGIVFGMYFYNLTVLEGLWVSLFSFIGAPSIYKLLKAQNVINYTPKSLDDCRGCVVIEQDNIIKREEK
jgi:hypothetical protein